jgi:hypothetical protein
MACPYFMPTAALAEPLWLHPRRLPLGGGFAGYCAAPEHEGELPKQDELRDFCNMGYAARCPRLPQDRRSDSNRFRVTQVGAQITISFCSERAHAPVEQATLTFDPAVSRWTQTHADSCVQRQAECALEAWRAQSARQEAEPANPPVQSEAPAPPELQNA